MPQMNPMNWLILFILLWSLMFSMFTQMYYMSKIVPNKKDNNINMNKPMNLQF